jgi:hypothetical protein
MALERRFFLFDVPEPGASALTNAQVLAMLAVQAEARWIVIRRRESDDDVYFACPRAALQQILAAARPDKPFGATLRSSPVPKAPPLDTTRYRSTGISPAVVLDEGVLIGVTVPVGRPTRGASGTVIRSLDTTRGGFHVLMHDGDVGPQELTSPEHGDASQDTPHRLEAFMPGEVALGQSAALVVTLDRIDQALAAKGDIGLKFGEPLQITVQGDAFLKAPSDNSRPIALRAGETSAALQFNFTAISVGEAKARVFGFRGDRCVARINLPVRTVGPGVPADTAAWARDESRLFPADRSTTPDLRLVVIEGVGEIKFDLYAGTKRIEDFPPVPVRDLARYMRQFADSVEGLSVTKPGSAEAARRKLEAWGSGLFSDLIPGALQQLLWAQPDAVTLQICSDDAWIPWEACRLVRVGPDNRVEEGRFFAEAFAMTRWLHGSTAPHRLRMSRCALVVPTTSGLETAERERAFYRGLAGEKREVTEIEPRYLALTRAMAKGTFDAWHYCGHANAGPIDGGDRAALRLDGNETMTADLFAGTVQNALIPRPLIFFNACQSAMGGDAMTGVGGWARRFIRCRGGRPGAAAFIGTYWSIYDTAAYRFATALYDNLCRQGQAIGLAARNARRNAMVNDGQDDPLSWLAYTVYADPLATLEEP